MISLLRKRHEEKSKVIRKPISIMKENRAYEDDVIILCHEKRRKPFSRNIMQKTAVETSLARFFENVQGLINR